MVEPGPKPVRVFVLLLKLSGRWDCGGERKVNRGEVGNFATRCQCSVFGEYFQVVPVLIKKKPGPDPYKKKTYLKHPLYCSAFFINNTEYFEPVI